MVVYFIYYGFPSTSEAADRNTQFIEIFWKALFQLLDIKLLLSSIHHLQLDVEIKEKCHSGAKPFHVILNVFMSIIEM